MTHMHKDCYAYPGRAMYPIHSKQATQESLVRFNQDKAGMPASIVQGIQERLHKAASVYAIDIDQVMPKQASQDLVSIQVGSSIVRMSKMASTTDILSAAERVIALRSKHSRKELQKVARYILKRGMELQQVAGNDSDCMATATMNKIAEIAGIGVGNKAEITEQFAKRADLVHFAPRLRSFFVEAYSKLQKTSEQDFYKEASLSNICDTLESIDAMYDLQSYYGKGIQEPEAVCYKTKVADMHKTAMDMLMIPSTGTVISKAALLVNKEAALDYLNTYYGVQKDASDAVLFEKVASLDKSAACNFLDSLNG